MSTELNDMEAPPSAEEVAAVKSDNPQTVETVETPEQGEETPEQKQEKAERAAKSVPIQALDEQKHKRRAAEAEAQRVREQYAVVSDRLNQLLAMQQHANQPQVDPNDPLAVHEHQLRQNNQRLEQLERERFQQHAIAQQQHQVQQLVGWAQAQAGEFAKENADFNEAYQHVSAQRLNMIKATGIPHQEAVARLQNDELWVYSEAARTGRNPAEIIYQMARDTGYVKKGSQPQQKMESMQKGVQASKTLSNGASTGKPTPEQVAAMTDDEFAEFKKGFGKKVSEL